MKLKMIVAAVAAAASSAAMANLPPQWGGPAVSADNILTISGATASSDVIEQFMRTTFCDPAGTVGVFHDDDDNNGDGIVDFGGEVDEGDNNTNWAIYCDAPAGLLTDEATTGRAILMEKANTGSGDGVAPVCDRSKTINYLAITGTDLASSNCAVMPTFPGTGNTTRYLCDAGGAGSVAKTPSFGISDVGPTEVVSGFSKNCDRVEAYAMLPFTVVVTDSLYFALQEAQGLTVGAFDEANMPSLPRQLVVGIFTGRIGSWDDVTFDGTPLTAFGGGPDAGTGGVPASNIMVCRRSDTSGTHASILITLLRNPSIAGADPFVSQGISFTPGVASFLQTSGSSDQRNCMTMLNDVGGGASWTSNPGLFGGFTFTDELPSWGISYQSATKDSSGTRGYQRVKIDGYAGNVDNTAAGFYYVVTNSSLQWELASSGASNGVSANEQDIIDATFLSSRNANTLPALETAPWGQVGFIATSDADLSCQTAPFDPSAPCMPYSVSASGGINNNLDPRVVPGSKIDLKTN